MNESMTEVATTTFVVRVCPAAGVISGVWGANRSSLGNAQPKDA
jgi:hypothetical protein